MYVMREYVHVCVHVCEYRHTHARVCMLVNNLGYQSSPSTLFESRSLVLLCAGLAGLQASRGHLDSSLHLMVGVSVIDM